MPKPTRGAKATATCEHCGKPFVARVADIQRGWGRYHSKACKAQAQKQRELTTICQNQPKLTGE